MKFNIEKSLFMGKVIGDMTREELIQVIEHMAISAALRESQIEKERKIFSDCYLKRKTFFERLFSRG